jgi:hypothetical protein
MKRSRLQWLLRLSILPVIALGLLVWGLGVGSQKAIAFENRSGKPIALLKVTVAGETSTFHNVREGAEVSAPLKGKGDAAVVVTGELSDGTLLRGKFGSLAPLMSGGRASFLVLPGGAIIPRPNRQSQGPPDRHSPVFTMSTAALDLSVCPRTATVARKVARST